MGMTIAKLWDGFFGKKEMRILMVGLDAAGKVSPFFLSKENLSDTRYRQLFCINWSWEKLLQLFPLSDLMLKLLNTKTFVLPFGMSVDKIRYVKNLFCCSCWHFACRSDPCGDITIKTRKDWFLLSTQMIAIVLKLPVMNSLVWSTKTSWKMQLSLYLLTNKTFLTRWAWLKLPTNLNCTNLDQETGISKVVKLPRVMDCKLFLYLYSLIYD